MSSRLQKANCFVHSQHYNKSKELSTKVIVASSRPLPTNINHLSREVPLYTDSGNIYVYIFRHWSVGIFGVVRNLRHTSHILLVVVLSGSVSITHEIIQ